MARRSQNSLINSQRNINILATIIGVARILNASTRSNPFYISPGSSTSFAVSLFIAFSDA